jgi:c-di-GMP-binding flagellar brake protein YcgR
VLRNGYKNIEERKSARLKYPLVVEYKIIKGGNKEKVSKSIKGEIKNISLGGTCLLSNSLEMDGLHIYHDSNTLFQNLLELEIDLPSGFGQVTALGKVAWFDLAKRRGKYQYEIGVVFLEMIEEDKNKLSKFIDKELYNER